MPYKDIVRRFIFTPNRRTAVLAVQFSPEFVIYNCLAGNRNVFPMDRERLVKECRA